MTQALRTFRVRPTLPEPLRPLSDLAANLRWAWDARTRELFRWADATLWDEVDGNPVELLARLSPDRAEALVIDAAFVAELRGCADSLERYLSENRWAQSHTPTPPRVAYFSPEFGLTHVMQTYSGGLGVLAGDHCKAASDLGLDLVGVGLLYRGGYFRQHLDADGWQREEYPNLNPYGLPLRRLETDDGEPLAVEVELDDVTVRCAVWTAEVGRVPLLLLDTDLPSNAPADRAVTDKLYGGGVEHRLRQEIVLGIGGMRALELAAEHGALGARDDQVWRAEVFHSNEGHAGFLQLERIRALVAAGLTFDEAVEAARARTLFTTHTPVAAGIDVFSRELMQRYFTGFAGQCGVDLDRLMAVGQTPAATPDDDFNMAVMGLHLSAAANGVSQLHGRVARAMFTGLWPSVATDETPITSVTNGVHAATWVGREMAAVYDRHLAPDWPSNPEGWARAAEIRDDELWRARGRARERLVQGVREAVRRQSVRRGEARASLGWTDDLFDPEALTVGFARRFAEYKRGALLFSDMARLRSLVLSTDRPVQLVFAGKAHPKDELGKDIIRRLVHASLHDEDLRRRIVFVEDYDMDIARVLYAGSDVWLNNPRRPYEACGTSGEKAVLNGALHCSTLDGWWDELSDGENGFVIGAESELTDVAQQDSADAASLYDLLERTVVPMFYDRAEGPLPRRWLARVRRSLVTLGPQVLAERMVREYADRLYTPIAGRAARLEAGGHARARALALWRRRLGDGWKGVRVLDVEVEGTAAAIGGMRDVRARIETGDLAPDDVRVELLHGTVRADGELVKPRTVRLEAQGDAAYGGLLQVSGTGEYGLAVRVVPDHPDLTSWADTGLVAWAQQ